MKSGSMNSQKKTNVFHKNTYETPSDSPKSPSMINDFKQLGGGIFDQFFGGGSDQGEYGQHQEAPWAGESKHQAPQPRKEFSLFKYNEYYEKELIKKEIKQLTEQITKEIQNLKKADSALLAEVKDIENLSLEEGNEKPGIYHIRFLEVVLSILRSLREKVGESRTWLAAMTSKKKKRGSLFANTAKKKGTQYSLSQELQTTRSVQ